MVVVYYYGNRNRDVPVAFLCYERGEFDGIIYEREGTANYVWEWFYCEDRESAV